MLRMICRSGLSFLVVALLLLLSSKAVWAQNTSFTYQGRLTDGATAANGNYDLQFALFDSLAVGVQIGTTQTISSVSVSAGIFTVSLDFGASAFPGGNRWLEISARVNGTPTFTVLSPRQPISSTPYAVRALTAATAESVTAGGTVTGNVVNAASQFNLNGNRIVGLGPNSSLNNFLVGLNTGNALSDGRENTFMGVSAGQATTGGGLDCTQCGPGGTALFKGSHGTFVGYRAGASNTTGAFNSFFGSSAGASNGLGSSNSFFGSFAGTVSRGSANSFFGAFAGYNNFSGNNNAFFGQSAGGSNIAGSDNAFFGWFAGSQNLGGNNSFFGSDAGFINTTGTKNTFIGYEAGSSNTTGEMNTLIGASANIASFTLTNATAIGANAFATQSNSVILGGITGINNGTSVNVGIGTTTPQATLDVKGTGVYRTGPTVQEVSFGSPGGETGIVIKGPSNRADIRFNGTTLKLVAGLGAGPPSNANGLEVDTNGNVGIGSPPAPLTRLWVTGLSSNQGSHIVRVENSTGQDSLIVRDNRTVAIGQLGSTPSAVHVCVDSANTFTQCSSSLRFKNHVVPFNGGLELISKLRPIRFNWKHDGTPDLGLGAEEVAEVEPLLVTHNNEGQIQGVKYDQLNVILINAIKQQQTQIEQLQRQQKLITLQETFLTKQQQQIAGLKKLVCIKRRRIGVCK